jgi:hypothetical protein
MKSKITKKETKNRPFPKLMTASSGVIVLMVNGNGDGTVVSSTLGHTLGDSSGGWDMEQFVDFEGTVELSND